MLHGKECAGRSAMVGGVVFDRLERAGRRSYVRRSLPIGPSVQDEAELAGTRALIFATARRCRFLAWFAASAQRASHRDRHRREIGILPSGQGALQRRQLRFDLGRRTARRGSCITGHQEDQPARRADQLFLIDSGAQFVDGTTDVTRTVAVGKPSAEIARPLHARAEATSSSRWRVSPEGTTGAQLTPSRAGRCGCRPRLRARHRPRRRLLFVVHEGTRKHSTARHHAGLKAGMICRTRPGYYKTGE